MMNYINCPLCKVGSESLEKFAVVRGWKYNRCPNCGLFFLNPQPDEKELTGSYRETYQYNLQNYRKNAESIYSIDDEVVKKP